MEDFTKGLLKSAVIGVTIGAVIGSLLGYYTKDTSLKTLSCSGRVVVLDSDYLYMSSRSNTYQFSGGSYTPKQGEICMVYRREVE